MKHRKKWMVLAVVVLAAAVFTGLYWWYTTTPEYMARQLVKEMRPCIYGFRTSERWLVKIGLKKEPRDMDEIVNDLLALRQASVRPLIQTLSSDDQDKVRGYASWILVKIGSLAVPDLIQSLKDGDNTVQVSAAHILGEIKPKARKAIPFLNQALKDESADVRKSAASALGRIGLTTDRTVPSLIEVLKDHDSNVRYCAVQALGEIGSTAKAAVPALNEVLKDEDEYVRHAAAEALKQIEAKATKQENRLPQPD